MPVVNGVFTPLTLDTALNEILSAAPSSIVFAPGNPPELILANMFAQAAVDIDENNGEIMSLFMSPIGAMIDLMNPNNPRKDAISAIGYVTVTNSTDADIALPSGTILSAATGQQYTTGSTSLIIPASGSLDVPVTAVETGVGGNLPSGQAFTIPASSHLSGTNMLPFLSGADRESDAIYLNRITGERSEYGAQNGSIAVETELKDYYTDARIYVNNTTNGLTLPIPVPANGYNLIVRTPNGRVAQSAEISQIFKTLSNRLEFVNSQNIGGALHPVLSGSVYNNGVPLSYYFTPAQPVDLTMSITVNIRAALNADASELIAQANDFAAYFIGRLMRLLSGINGTTNVTYNDGVHAATVTPIAISGAGAQSGSIAPSFGVGTIQALVNDIDTMLSTPLVLFDSVPALTITIDPLVTGQTPIVLSIGGSTQFISFENDALFSDGSSFFDRYAFIDPSKISVTMQVVAWM